MDAELFARHLLDEAPNKGALTLSVVNLGGELEQQVAEILKLRPGNLKIARALTSREAHLDEIRAGKLTLSQAYQLLYPSNSDRKKVERRSKLPVDLLGQLAAALALFCGMPRPADVVDMLRNRPNTKSTRQLLERLGKAEHWLRELNRELNQGE